MKIVHKINLTDIESTISTLKNKYSNKSETELGKILHYELENVKNSMKRLTPFKRRNKRWDAYGSFIKLISGVPDADDLRRIDAALHNLENNSNNQVKINDEIEKKINEILDAVNSNNVNGPNIDTITVIFNIRIINDKLTNILDAISLASKNIISRKLLKLSEVEYLAQTLTNQGIHLQTMEQAFEYTSAEVEVNNETISYTLAVPKLQNTTYDVIKIRPITRNNEQTDIQGEFATKFPTVYEIKKPCNQYQELQICDRHHLTNKSADPCLFDTIFKAQAKCNFKNSSATNKITQLTPTIILIENANTTFINHCNDEEPKKMTGSFIINYTNCSITVNNEKFTDNIIKTSHSPKLIEWWKPEILKPSRNMTKLKLNKATIVKATHRTDWVSPTSTILIILLLILVTIRCSK